MSLTVDKINDHFKTISLNDEWRFENSRSTYQYSHGYHRYPAKFIPDLVKKIIEERTDENDVIADLFAGCGTTLLEAKLHGRKSVGVDINPVAELITKAKITAHNPTRLKNVYDSILTKISLYDGTHIEELKKHDRIDYWFDSENKAKISYLFEHILDIENKNIRIFFLCALSNIFKNCSRWLQSSTKPQIDPEKIPQDPFQAFSKQVKFMLKTNDEFYSHLKSNGFDRIRCDIRMEDARRTSIRTNSVGAIITSPPYVTSYEYADIHQLTGYWYDFIDDLLDFRKRFIGTFYSRNEDLSTQSEIGDKIIKKLKKKDLRAAREVANYVNDMYDVIIEMKRILKPGGHVCIVIGNTTFKDVKILSSEIITELLLLNDFSIKEEDTIKRAIPVKQIPTIRDKKTGRFTTLESKNSKRVYPEEYIIIASNN